MKISRVGLNIHCKITNNYGTWQQGCLKVELALRSFHMTLMLKNLLYTFFVSCKIVQDLLQNKFINCSRCNITVFKAENNPVKITCVWC